MCANLFGTNMLTVSFFAEIDEANSSPSFGVEKNREHHASVTAPDLRTPIFWRGAHQFERATSARATTTAVVLGSPSKRYIFMQRRRSP
jgi:hypothetical protein